MVIGINIDWGYIEKDKFGLYNMNQIGLYFTDFSKFYEGLKVLEKRNPLIRAMVELPGNKDENSDTIVDYDKSCSLETTTNGPSELLLDGLNIIDGTAGLGADSFLLARAGATISLVERNPIAYLLLKDGFTRSKDISDPKIQEIRQKMTLLDRNDCANVFDNILIDSTSKKPDIVYLDLIHHIKKKNELKRSGPVKLHLPRYEYYTYQKYSNRIEYQF